MAKISIFNKQHHYLISKSLISKIAKCTLDHLEVICDEVAFYFVDAKTICKLHKQFFNDSSLTDCITFPYDEKNTKNCFLGEVIICPYVAFINAKKHKSSLKEEISLYLIHGILHLIGYKDQKPSDKRIMKKMEKSCMDLLKENKII